MPYIAVPASTGSGVSQGTLVTLGGDTQDWDFATGLAGDTDGDYIVTLNIVADATGRTFTLLPNGSAPTTSNGTYFYSNTGVGTFNANQSNTFVVGISNSSATCEINFRLNSKSGRVRALIGNFFTDTSTAASNLPGWYQYNWLDTGTVLTSLRLHGSAANSIKATSTARYQKQGFLA